MRHWVLQEAPDGPGWHGDVPAWLEGEQMGQARFGCFAGALLLVARKLDRRLTLNFANTVFFAQKVI